MGVCVAVLILSLTLSQTVTHTDIAHTRAHTHTPTLTHLLVWWWRGVGVGGEGKWGVNGKEVVGVAREGGVAKPHSSSAALPLNTHIARKEYPKLGCVDGNRLSNYSGWLQNLPHELSYSPQACQTQVESDSREAIQSNSHVNQLVLRKSRMPSHWQHIH